MTVEKIQVAVEKIQVERNDHRIKWEEAGESLSLSVNLPYLSVVKICQINGNGDLSSYT